MAIELIWIILGVVYILYSVYRENPKAVITSAITFVLLVIIAVVQNTFLSSKSNISLPVKQIICGVILIVMPIIILSMCVGVAGFFDKKQISWRNEFCSKFKSIYPKISDQTINNIWSNPNSPVNNGKLKATAEDCYVWMCKERQYELERLSLKELSQLLGINIDLIPLNDKKHISDARSQRKGLVIQELLKREGLAYSKEFRPWMYGDLEYERAFQKYITK